MRTLHLACMPFPSPQGTQAVVAAMMRALPDATLLTYAGGSGQSDIDPLRLSNFPRVSSLRSGPSLGKAILDLRMVGDLRRRVAQLRPQCVVAHNVEAACVAWASRVPRWVYFAHTRFDTELPTYSQLPGLAMLGRGLDTIATRADMTLAITPALATHLGGQTMLPPWSVEHVASAEERREARIGLNGPVLVYAGNLDGYQGVDMLFEATRGYTLVVATESDGELPSHARRWRLRNEDDRRRAHAAADLVVVPRRSPGGLPIKLLDALARDVPVVAQRRALAGLKPDGVLTTENNAASLRAGIESALANPPRGGRAWIQANLGAQEFATRFFQAIRPEAR